MDDLIAFLEARLAEDEATARGVKPLGHTDALGGIRIEHAFAVTRLVASGEDGSYRGEADEAAAAHFRRHDPARVLRGAAALHQILRMYREATAGGSLVSPFLRGQDDGFRQALEEVLKVKANVWAGHPDFRSEWSTGEATDG